MYSNDDLERFYFQYQTEAVPFNRYRDFLSMTPQNIGLAYSKYRANEYKVKLACTLSSAADIHYR